MNFKYEHTCRSQRTSKVSCICVEVKVEFGVKRTDKLQARSIILGKSFNFLHLDTKMITVAQYIPI